jgi:hypothetical protein
VFSDQYLLNPTGREIGAIILKWGGKGKEKRERKETGDRMDGEEEATI